MAGWLGACCCCLVARPPFLNYEPVFSSVGTGDLSSASIPAVEPVGSASRAAIRAASGHTFVQHAPRALVDFAARSSPLSLANIPGRCC